MGNRTNHQQSHSGHAVQTLLAPTCKRESCTWRVDDQQAGHPQVELLPLAAQLLRAGPDVGGGHIRGADLLRDAARLAVLHVRPPHIVQDLRLACTDTSPVLVLQLSCREDFGDLSCTIRTRFAANLMGMEAHDVTQTMHLLWQTM